MPMLQCRLVLDIDVVLTVSVKVLTVHLFLCDVGLCLCSLSCSSSASCYFFFFYLSFISISTSSFTLQFVCTFHNSDLNLKMNPHKFRSVLKMFKYSLCEKKQVTETCKTVNRIQQF